MGIGDKMDCLSCGSQFVRKTPWHSFCSVKCKTLYNQILLKCAKDEGKVFSPKKVREEINKMAGLKQEHKLKGD